LLRRNNTTKIQHKSPTAERRRRANTNRPTLFCSIHPVVAPWCGIIPVFIQHGQAETAKAACHAIPAVPVVVEYEEAEMELLQVDVGDMVKLKQIQGISTSGDPEHTSSPSSGGTLSRH
jgi:flavoprotein